MTIKALVIAPDAPDLPRLKSQTEAMQIGDIAGIHAELLIGDVPAWRLLNRFQDGPYHVILWIGHGDNGGLLLSDGSRVEPRWLAGQLAYVNARVAVLSVCDTAGRAAGGYATSGFSDIIPALGIDLVVMGEAVTDAGARAYDLAFLQALAAGRVARAAHETGVEALARTGEAKSALFFAGSVPAGEELKALSRDISALETALDGKDFATAHAIMIDLRQTILAIDRLLSDTYRLTFTNQAAITHISGRLEHVEAIVKPPVEVKLWRFGATSGMIVLACAILVTPLREIVFATPAVGVFIVAQILALSALSLRLSIMAARRSRNGKNSGPLA